MLIKPQEMDTGITCEYWVIREITFSKRPRNCVVTLGLWKNKQAYQDNKKCIKTIAINFGDANFPLTNANWQNVQEAIENKLRATEPLFADAVVD